MIYKKHALGEYEQELESKRDKLSNQFLSLFFLIQGTFVPNRV